MAKPAGCGRDEFMAQLCFLFIYFFIYPFPFFSYLYLVFSLHINANWDQVQTLRPLHKAWIYWIFSITLLYLSGLLDFSAFFPFSHLELCVQSCEKLSGRGCTSQPLARAWSAQGILTYFIFAFSGKEKAGLGSFLLLSLSNSLWNTAVLQRSLMMFSWARVGGVCGCEGAEEGRARGAQAPKSPRSSLPRVVWSLPRRGLAPSPWRWPSVCGQEAFHTF